LLRAALHFTEQKRTSSQQRCHFLRHTKGRSQIGQILLGRSDFLRILGIDGLSQIWLLVGEPISLGGV
jgi:hypothetical protein